MTDLTQQEIEQIHANLIQRNGNLNPEWMRTLISYMAGYLATPSMESESVEGTRQMFFWKVKQELERTT